MPLIPLPIRLSLMLVALTALTASGQAATSSIAFNKDIRPILTENCFLCHGPDPGTRKAGLRLDTREGLYDATPKRGPTVVPGHPEKSEMWRRLNTTDPDDVMPPPDSHKEVTSVQKNLIRRWIEEGAAWQAHWSFVKPERPSPAAVGGQNAIDRFLLAKLSEKGLTFNQEADRRTLARRLSLDLTGLPPKPGMVERFVQDKSPDYYEKLVRELMRSQHYGEHRARYWLDAARYADTHGLHFDNLREMWPYRDWVIRAFNRNMPFDQFTVEQLAGDLLPDATDDQKTATGFHRCNITTNEGGSIEEENLTNYARDRVETTAWVWLGLTANCAVCHDHKFDPITAKDFYSMSAFFRNTTQGGFDGNVKDSSPNLILVSDPAKRKRWDALPAEMEKLRKDLAAVRTNTAEAFTNWASRISYEELEKEVFARPGLVARLPLNDGDTNRFVSIVRGKTNQFPFGSATALRSDGKYGPAPKFVGEKGPQIPALGDFDRQDAFSVGGWFYLPNDYNDRATMIARMDESNGLRGWELWHEQGQLSVHLVNHWPENMLKVRSKTRIGRRGGWQHVMFTYDGSSRPEGIRIFTDGKPADLEVDHLRKLRGSIRSKAPFTLTQRQFSRKLPETAVQDVRIYNRALAAPEVKALADLPNFKEFLSKMDKDYEKKSDHRQALREYFLATRNPAFQKSLTQLARLEHESDGIRLNNAQTHVQQEKTNSMGMAHILFRGQYDKPKDKVEPAVIAALHPLPEGAPHNRLGLAQWIVSPENPLTARVTVNRLWQELFGTGLVKTSEDFGIMGDKPSHPELLDWLAVEFRESGWDVRHMLELMVSSAAYRQSAVTSPEKLEKDPANRLLSRAPRFRMDAEMVRDYALAASGLLDETIGGPSVKPYQPPGVWEAVAMPESNTRYYDLDTGSALYRRSMYTFWKRAAPPALMDVLNAPSRETSCLRRERTNTPLQALATLNDPEFIESARHLAETALRKGGRRDDEVLDRISTRALARELSNRERDIVLRSQKRFLSYYEGNPEAARELIAVGQSKLPRSGNPASVAAWTMVANQLLNLDEVLNK